MAIYAMLGTMNLAELKMQAEAAVNVLDRRIGEPRDAKGEGTVLPFPTRP